MKISIRFLFALLTLFIFTGISHAQKWQWGKRGGSPSGTNATGQDENVIDITTDRQGNVYYTAIIESSSNPTIAGRSVTGFGQRDIALFSLNCSGALRWVKMIGTNSIDAPSAVSADTMGHIYLSGYSSVPGIHFDADTVLPATALNKRYFIAQYDTSGHLNWIRQPLSDTVSANTVYLNQLYDVFVEPNGTLNVLMYLQPGRVETTGNWSVPAARPYILRYNVQGILQSIVPLDMNLSNNGQNFTWIPDFRMSKMRSGKFVLTGTKVVSYASDLSFAGQPYESSMFVACFNDRGQLNWLRGSNDIYASVGHRAIIDDQSNIYVTGGGWNGTVIGTDTIHTAHSGVPFTLKMDSSGRNKWLTNASDNSVPFGIGFVTGQCQGAAIAFSGNEVIVSGSCAPLKWGPYSRTAQPNSGYTVFVARFDKETGAIHALDSVAHASGGYDMTSVMAAGKNGSVYIAGALAGGIYAGNDTIYNSGSDEDIFMLKYGYPCNCSVPTAAFSYSNSSARTVSMTYNGSAPADSVTWSFGDGSSARGTSAAHTYAESGTYQICAAAHTACGIDKSCKLVTINATGISNTGFDNLKIYPNPANDQFTIDPAGQALTYALYDLEGRQIVNGSIQSKSQNISISNLSSGTYILELQSREGNKYHQKIVKQ